MTQPAITIYTTPTCHFCHMAKAFFQDNHLTYTEHDVATDARARREMIEKSGQMGVPVICVDKQIVVGFDESRLRALLGV